MSLIFGSDGRRAVEAAGMCRSCGTPLNPENALCDLGALPLANALLTADQLDQPETHYPLRPLVCHRCLLVQLPATPAAAAIFTETYPFYAGQSTAWREHCGAFAADVVDRFGLDPVDSRVLEIGSNDGTMLHAFGQHGIRALGVEPCRGVAKHALRRGLATDVAFWGEAYAVGMDSTGYSADLVVATNVLAHVPDLQDFLRGVAHVLAADGVAVFEAPYVGCLIAEGQFDQIYAEHHCYFGVSSLRTALANAGLELADVEFVGTHGGSLRAFAVRDDGTRHLSGLVETAYEAEVRDGLADMATYRAFATVPPQIKRGAWQALIDIRRMLGKDLLVAGYGASAKASTFLTYCGIGPESLAFVADTTPAKQGHYLPGSRIPIVSPEALAEAKPDVVVNLLWNWREESERNIRAACPGATLLYLRHPDRAAVEQVA